jgi:hypothetical protein
MGAFCLVGEHSPNARFLAERFTHSLGLALFIVHR